MSGEQGNWRKHVAEEILVQIERGTAPWQKPWAPGVVGDKPHNPASNRAYNGINTLWLEMQGYRDPRWLTLRQANEMGASVRAGEKATKVEYWMLAESKPVIGDDGLPQVDENGKPITHMVPLERPRVFYANVFNAAQIDGLEPYKAPEPGFEPLQKAEELLAGGGVEIRHDQNDRAFYQPGQDEIHLPPQSAFSGAYEYYATAMHELGHATGHRSRMHRDFGPFGSEVYAKEELRAELTSYIMARDLGLGHFPERHANYVENWMQALKEDPNFLFQAARDADQIAQWIQEPEKRQALEKAAQEKRKGEKMERDKDRDTPPKAEKPKRTYLAVPFTEKDQAKAAGAKWDRKLKSWYVPEGTDMAQVAKWVADKQVPPAEKSVDPAKEFGEELEKQGVVIKGSPILDGKWHRAKLSDDKGSAMNASYRGFLNGRPNGQIKNFQTGELIKWAATGEELSKEQLAALRAEAEVKKQERFAEIREAQKEARLVAMEKFDKAMPASEHAYLGKKGVQSHGLHMSEDGHLLVPARDVHGKLWSVQSIGEDGSKRFQKNARKTGLMHVIDPDNKIGEKVGFISNKFFGNGTVFIAEGYATAADVHEATKRPTVVAFDAGNLKPVAEAVHKQYPHAKIVIAADNDHTLESKPYGNIGINKATEAAVAVGGFVVSPSLTDEQKERGLSDWNDLRQDKGAQELVRQFREQLSKQRGIQKGDKQHSAALEM
ncbi:MAG: DUF1738 domain-containing protein [Alphaproteobacteria bacterium]|nr:DUF1738 domain-containing protein [Alphaproteobacteria bacterium]